jgi:hypothetical protein
VREFFADYKVKRWGARPRDWRENARLLGLCYPPDCDPADTEPEVMRGSLADTWADKPVAEITDDDIYAVVDSARRQRRAQVRAAAAPPRDLGCTTR